MATLKQIRQYVRGIATEFKPKKVILFGSHATKKARRDSDVDLLVVMPHKGQAVRTAIKIRRTLDAPFPMDLLVRSPEELKKRLKMNDWFMHDIVEQGKVLYETRNP